MPELKYDEESYYYEDPISGVIAVEFKNKEDAILFDLSKAIYIDQEALLSILTHQ